jgi:hypothetical protein
VADDEELAELQATGNAPAGAPVVPMTEYSPEAERLSALIDVMRELLSLEIGKATRKKVKPVKPYPRPVTAAQRVARRRKYEKFLDLRKRLLGDRVHGGG